MASVILNLPEPPTANRYWRHNRGRIHVSTEAVAYRKMVAHAYLLRTKRMALTFPKGTPVSVQVEWVRGRKSGDLDNRLKVVLDALRKVAYADDSQVVAIHAYRIDDKGKPSLRVTISEAS